MNERSKRDTVQGVTLPKIGDLFIERSERDTVRGGQLKSGICSLYVTVFGKRYKFFGKRYKFFGKRYKFFVKLFFVYLENYSTVNYLPADTLHNA